MVDCRHELIEACVRYRIAAVDVHDAGPLEHVHLVIDLGHRAAKDGSCFAHLVFRSSDAST